MDYQIISKGYYSYPQSIEQITLKQFMFALKNDKKCLLLRFSNNEENPINGIDFLILEMDSRGNKIGEQLVKAHDIYCAGGDNFSINEDIFINENCTDFKIQIVAADFGDYKYSFKKDNVSVSYAPTAKEELDPSIKKDMGLQKKSVMPKSYKIGSFLLIVVVITLLAAFGVTWAQLSSFINSTTVFTMDNIEFEFVDGEESKQVIVTNYTGYETNIIIPEKIDEYTVVSIKEGALSNKKITSVKVDGAILIGERAFANCTDLKTVDLGKSTTVCSQAFYNCTSLESISSEHLLTLGDRAFEDCKALESITFNGNQTLALGSDVFQNCENLKNVVIEQPLSLSDGVANIFANDFNIENLTIKSINFADPNDTLHMLYGKTYAEQISYALKSVSLGNLNKINPYLFYNFTNLEEVSIDSLEEKSAGAHSFEGCYNLSTLNFDDLSVVGDYAFKSTNLKSFNLGKIESLGSYAFYSCANLDVDISELKVPTISAYAFGECVSLKSVKPSDQVRKIENNAFTQCSNVKEIVLGPNIESVGLGAFEKCDALTEISLPFLGESTTSSNKHFAYIFGNGNSNYSDIQVKVPSSLKTVTINSDITAIPDKAFYHCQNIQSISIPTTITSIGQYAFNDCKFLKKVTLPEGLLSIDKYAFSNCSTLTNITIPVSVESIGQYILTGDTALESITIPFIGLTKTDDTSKINYLFSDAAPESLKLINIENAEFIANDAFKGSDKITAINILSEGLTSIGTSAFENCSSLIALQITSTVLTEIKDRTFYGTGIEEFVVQSNIKSIGASAFEKSNLTSITFNGELTSIKDNAFKGTKLISVNLPKIQNVGESIFANNLSLKSVTQQDGALTIGEREFEQCSSLESIAIASSVTSIGQNCLEGCSSLISVELPFIGKEDANEAMFFSILFGDTTAQKPQPSVPSSLTNVTITNATIIPNNAFYNLSSIKSIDLNGNDKLVSIGSNAFYGCTALNVVNIPSSVQTLASTAFEGCYKLVEVVDERDSISISSQPVNAPSVLNTYSTKEIRENRKNIVITDDGFEFYRAGMGDLSDTSNNDWYLVDYNHSLAALELPKSVSKDNVTINKYNLITHFAYDNALIESLSLPTTIISIGDSAFGGCINISDFEFSTANTLELVDIGENAFNGCAKISEVNFPASTTIIKYGAFRGCISLSIVKLPSSITTIEDNAFENCVSLFDVYNLTALPIEKDSIEYGQVAKNALLVHTNISEKSLHDAHYGNFLFKTNGTEFILFDVEGSIPTAINFESFESREEETLGQQFKYDIRKDIFKGSNIKSIIISKAVKNLPNNCFANCKKLESIDMSNATSLDCIPDNAFKDCSNVSSIILSSTLVSIGDSAFNGCSSVKAINIPNTLTDIGENAFYDCYNLEKINNANKLPNGIINIRPYTFYNCSRLFNISLPNNLETIGDSAFYSCYGLSIITLPSTLESIDSNAFTNCTHLYGVCNLSSIEVTKGNTTNGRVASAAKFVCTNVNELNIQAAIDDGYYYLLCESYSTNWCLYSVPNFSDENLVEFIDNPTLDKYTKHTSLAAFESGTQYYELNDGIYSLTQDSTPQAEKVYFTYSEEIIDSYQIEARTINNELSNINKAIISSNVAKLAARWYYKSIQSTNYTFEGEIYYYGNSTAFDTLAAATNTYSKENTTVFFYASCVHEDNQWSYLNGEITTTKNEFILDDRMENPITSTNCSVSQTIHYYCPICLETKTEVVSDGKHDLDENNECTICHWVVINADNIGTNEHITLENANDALTYNKVNSTIAVSAKRGAEVSIIIRTDEAITVTFFYQINFTESASFFQVYQYIDGEWLLTSLNYGKEMSDGIKRSKTYNLAAGEKYKLTVKTSSGISTTVKDTVILYDLKIKKTI